MKTQDLCVFTMREILRDYYEIDTSNLEDWQVYQLRSQILKTGVNAVLLDEIATLHLNKHFRELLRVLEIYFIDYHIDTAFCLEKLSQCTTKQLVEKCRKYANNRLVYVIKLL